ncbi:DUF4367 domain-containing protein [Acetivibrio ethanolgignens]|uniref:DUF4367 domain-containing protein n=1 Tax=Acetivibrio ethanolgignens TaxID=290052 RepID=A0A0V8QFC9_9FIRM|nr:DUF4367 domain-containing protein [Acetivibrio ethanolgignens]KSV59118.1 hypothetical protein ASU35_02045 [Acetivibrio ethanolgignens]
MKERKFNAYNVNEDEFMTALDEVEKLDLAELEAMDAEAEGEEPHEFSEEFMAKQVALIREVEKREKMPCIYRFIHASVKKVAIVVILVGAVALGFGGQSEAGKNPIVKFFQECYSDHIEIEPHGNLWQNEKKPQTIETVYELGWVPEGYEKELEERTEFSAVQVYHSIKKDSRIRLEQYCVIMYFSIKEEKNYKEILEDGIKFYFLNGEDENTAVWYQNGYQFVIRGSVQQDEALKLIKNIQEVK